MKDLYIVIDETKDGRFFATCPLIKGCSISGTSLNEVRKDMIQLVNLYLEKNIDLLEKKGVENEIKDKRYKSSVVPIW